MKYKLLLISVIALNSCTMFMQSPPKELTLEQVDDLLLDFTRIRIDEHLHTASVPANNRDIMIQAANENNIAPQIAFYYLQKKREIIFDRLFQ